MAIKVPILVTDPASLLTAGSFGAGALIRVESSATVGGVYAEISTIALVATTVIYDFWDTAGSGTTWYRWRVSNAGNTLDSPYTDPFQGTSPTTELVAPSYATVNDVLALGDTLVATPRLVARFARLLGPMSEEIDREIGRDFYRHPAVTGTEVRTFDGPGPRDGYGRPQWGAGRPVDGTASYGRLCVHAGIISLTSLEIRLSPLVAYELVDASDYELEQLVPEGGRPYDHIRLLGVARWAMFPYGPAAVRATGAFGWARPPRALVEGNAERVRQVAAMDATYAGAAAGPGEYGAARPFTPLPDVIWRFMTSESRRFACTL